MVLVVCLKVLVMDLHIRFRECSTRLVDKETMFSVVATSSYPRSPNLCPEAVVDRVCKTSDIYSKFMLGCPSEWLSANIVKNPDAPAKCWKEGR